MVASIDGSTALDGASAGLSSDADREVLLTLRSIADLIIVGAGTVRSEGYGVPNKPGQRIGVVSRSGDVDVASRLFASGAGFLILHRSSRYAQASGNSISAQRCVGFPAAPRSCRPRAGHR